MKKEVILKEIERKKKKNFDYKILCENKSWKFWYKLVDFCEEEMEKTVAIMAGIQDVEECWQVLKKDIVGVLEWGRKRVRRKEQEDEEKGMKEIKKELEKLKREKRKANVEQVRFKTLKNRIEKLRKKIRKMRMRKKIDSILACDKEEKKKYWELLKELGGWGRKGSLLPATVFDEQGKEKEGAERLEVWREAFQKLGEDHLDDPDFDKEFALSVEEEVSRMEKEREEEKEEKNMNEDEWKEEEGDDEETREKKRKKREERARKRLNRGISEEEVNKAIDQLRNFRTPGKDGVIGEILKEGGGKIRKAVWMMCCAAWKNEKVPRIGCKVLFFLCTKMERRGIQ